MLSGRSYLLVWTMQTHYFFESELLTFSASNEFRTELVFQVGKYEHVTPLLNELHWLPIGRRITFKILMLVYNCLHRNSPFYLCNLITHRNSRPGLRSSSDASILHIPRSNTSSGDNAFMVFAPKLWNALPLPIRQAPSLETFRKVLRTHLFVS